jgi:hypothetical protein
MRRKLLFGLGLAGVISGSALAQFAADRVPPAPTNPGVNTPALPAAPGLPAQPVPVQPAPPASPPSLPDGVRPIGSLGGAYVPPVGGIGSPPTPVSPYSPVVPPSGQAAPAVQAPPRDTTIHSALPANHPWIVKPEHGAFFICVKSYSRPSRPEPGDDGPSARELAEMLAGEIRDLYRVQAFLYEYISEERKAEMAAIAAARERARIFAGQLDKYKQEAQLKGMEFLEDDRVTVHFKTVKYRDQIAVLVGGFKSDEDAHKALEAMRKAALDPDPKNTQWKAPKNTILMDGAAIQRVGKDGKLEGATGYLNPYLTATVVPNPTIPRPQQAGNEFNCDPFLVKLNADEPYSLLKATKNWTLAVKSFTAPVEIVGRDGESGGMIRKPDLHKEKNVLAAGAAQAESMAKALREMKGPGGQPLGLEAFVLHTRSASLVTIGQFDSPNDPALLQMKQLLNGMKLNVTEDKTGFRPAMNTPSLFEKLLPVPIPHPQ